jgi:prepilin-type N-terminal cleavage/methylation domain-containing protein
MVCSLRPGRDRLRGFTLIELLVVIAIIAILASILLPVFATAREKARQTQCLSNTKQLSMATLMYVQDNDETFPPRLPNPDPTTGSYPCKPCRTIDVRIYLDPYVKSQAVFHCPSDSGIPSVFKADPTLGGPVYREPTEGGYGSSYCLNTVVTRLHKFAAIPDPAATYMGAEIFPWHSADPVGLVKGKSGAPARVTYFCDGHSRVVSEAAIAQQCVPIPSAPGIGPVP